MAATSCAVLSPSPCTLFSKLLEPTLESTPRTYRRLRAFNRQAAPQERGFTCALKRSAAVNVTPAFRKLTGLPVSKVAEKSQRRPGVLVRASADSESESGSQKAPFGYTRKDVIVLGFGVIAAGFALKYGLEVFGVDSLVAGNVIQITFVLGLTIFWVFTYVFRVANKEMTYVKQLKSYEEEVMKKRLEELPEAELENMLAAVEEEKRRLEDRRKAGQQQ